LTAPLSVAIVGRTERPTAFSSVNAVLAEGLSSLGFDVRRVSSAEALDRRFDRVVHHDYSQHFAELRRPECDRFIAIRTWDFGPFPRRFVEVANQTCDELWVPTQWIAEQARASGVATAKTHVVPHGVDLELMSAEGPRFELDRPGFRFLFVGAAVARKGVDVLLEAYGRAFTADDPVTLVIKDHGADLFYQGARLTGAIGSFVARRGAPHLVHLDAHLEPARLAALYRSCDAGVFPYRAEGFALPILEAMACGTPSIVPRFGAALDYCDADTAFPIPARRIRLPVARNLQFNTLGFREEVEEVDFCEVDPGVLAAEMRRVAALDRSSLERVSRAAAARAATFSWPAAIARVAERLLG